MADNPVEEEVQAEEGNENLIGIYPIPASDQTPPETASIRVLVTRNQIPWRAFTMNLDSLSFETDLINFGLIRNDQTMNLASVSSSANASFFAHVTRNEIPTCNQTIDLGSISFETDRIRVFFTQNQISTNDDLTGSRILATRPLRVLAPPDLSETLVLMDIEEDEEEEDDDDDDSASLITQPPFEVLSQLSPYAESYIPQNPYLQVQHQTFRSNQSAEPNRGEQENLYQQYPMDVFYIFVPFQAPVMYHQNQMQPVRSQGFYDGPSSYRGRGGYRGRARGRGRRG